MYFLIVLPSIDHSPHKTLYWLCFPNFWLALGSREAERGQRALGRWRRFGWSCRNGVRRGQENKSRSTLQGCGYSGGQQCFSGLTPPHHLWLSQSTPSPTEISVCRESEVLTTHFTHQSLKSWHNTLFHAYNRIQVKHTIGILTSMFVLGPADERNLSFNIICWWCIKTSLTVIKLIKVNIR